MSDKKCSHEEDVNYGKAVEVTETLRAIQIMCVDCGGVGTQIEQQDQDDKDYWYSISEIWHELPDYFANDYINSRNLKSIGVR